MTDLAEMLGIDTTSPEYIAARERAERQYANARISRCSNGCVNYHDPDTDEVFSGFGKAGCEMCS